MNRHVEDLLEHQPNGRLLAFDPKTGKSRTVLPDLYFANGVAVSPDQTFVLVAETGKYRVRRVWLKESKNDIFIDNLPGFPDGISSNGKDKFWLALVTPRQALVDRMLPYPFVRKIVVRLPNFLRPGPERYSFVLGLDSQGRVTDNLQNGSLRLPTPRSPTSSNATAPSISEASAKTPSVASCSVKPQNAARLPPL